MPLFLSPNAFERLAPMVDDYPEVKERQRRDVVPKAKGNMTNEWEAIEYRVRSGGGFLKMTGWQSPCHSHCKSPESKAGR